jgi:hypothetical protein
MLATLRDDIISLWEDPDVCDPLQVKGVRIEDRPGLCVVHLSHATKTSPYVFTASSPTRPASRTGCTSNPLTMSSACTSAQWASRNSAYGSNRVRLPSPATTRRICTRLHVVDSQWILFCVKFVLTVWTRKIYININNMLYVNNGPHDRGSLPNPSHIKQYIYGTYIRLKKFISTKIKAIHFKIKS